MAGGSSSSNAFAAAWLEAAVAAWLVAAWLVAAWLVAAAPAWLEAVVAAGLRAGAVLGARRGSSRVTVDPVAGRRRSHRASNQ